MRVTGRVMTCARQSSNEPHRAQFLRQICESEVFTNLRFSHHKARPPPPTLSRRFTTAASGGRRGRETAVILLVFIRSLWNLVSTARVSDFRRRLRYRKCRSALSLWMKLID